MLAILGGMALVVSVNLWLLIPSFILVIGVLLLYKFYISTLNNAKRLEATREFPPLSLLFKYLRMMFSLAFLGIILGRLMDLGLTSQ